MACQSMYMWSLSGLVAAFLDLAIAYLLLCGSSVAFFASKFLGFFGLNLPCPCDGLFLNIPSKEYCLNRLLVDFPTQRVSNVHLSVKQRFPFNDSVWGRRTHNCILGENDYVDGIPEIEGEGSCSSVSDARMSRIVVWKELNAREEEKYDLKGKGVIDHRPRSRLRQRRKGGGGGRGKYSSLSSYDPSVNEGGEPDFHSDTSDGGKELILPVENGFGSYHLDYNEKASTVMGVSQRSLSSVELNHCPNEDMHIKKVMSIEELQDHQHGVQNFSGDEKNTIRLLEQALEEERIARAALYIDLEKERSAAASAADEAMAMILRLQAEKASIEMEARQYQRIIEEKSAYDDEEMNIFKEILLRREREKHFLEKEVEAYRQMVSLGNEQLGGNDSDNKDAKRLFDLMCDPNDDPIVMLQQLAASNEKNVMTETSCSVSEDMQNCELAFGNESSNHYQDEKYSFQKQGDLDEQSVQISTCSTVGNIDLQEKEMISADSNLYSTPKGPQEYKSLENTTSAKGKDVEQIEEVNGGCELTEKIIVTCNGTEVGSDFDLRLQQQEKDEHIIPNDSCDGAFDKDSRVYDVHVISDQTDFCSKVNASKSEHLSVIKRVNVTTDCPSTSRMDSKVNVVRSSSDITCGLPPMGPKGKSLLSDLRRSSISAVDSEMLKIDCEVGKLRERLKIVQEGREKLSLSVESRERENLQLELLEDIACQVQEIRDLTQPEKAARQVSLPLPDSKVLSKKRRCRSVSSGHQRSSIG